MERAEPEPGPLPDDWCIQHFDHLSEELAPTMPATMARMRALCPVTHSDAHDGLWVVSPITFTPVRSLRPQLKCHSPSEWRPRMAERMLLANAQILTCSGDVDEKPFNGDVLIEGS